MPPDLDLAFRLADIADSITASIWSPSGVRSTTKADNSPVTDADIAAEHAMRAHIMESSPDDGFLGEELGEVAGMNGRRWIVDGTTCRSPMVSTSRPHEAFIQVVSQRCRIRPNDDRPATDHPTVPGRIRVRSTVEPPEPSRRRELDACIWYGGDIWDHAAPSIIVEEAGGRFSDHSGGTRLDTRTAIYSNGFLHDEILAAVTERPQA